MERYLRGALAVALDYARDRDDAEDIVQDAFIRTLRELDTFDDRLAFRPWFFTILRNLGRNAAARRARAARLVEPDAATAAAPAGDAAADAEVRGLVEHTLRGMSASQAAAFRLAVIEGFSMLEVAEMLGVAPATVRTHVHRARLKLRATLTRRGYGSPS